jgi:hypothetical protein
MAKPPSINEPEHVGAQFDCQGGASISECLVPPGADDREDRAIALLHEWHASQRAPVGNALKSREHLAAWALSLSVHGSVVAGLFMQH